MSKPLKISSYDLRDIEGAIESAEDALKAADGMIDTMIQKRGKIATTVQRLWNLRHTLKQRIEEPQ